MEKEWIELSSLELLWMHFKLLSIKDIPEILWIIFNILFQIIFGIINSFILTPIKLARTAIFGTGIEQEISQDLLLVYFIFYLLSWITFKIVNKIKSMG